MIFYYFLQYMNQNTLNRALVEVENLPPDKDDKSETGNSDATGITTNQSKRRKLSMNSLNLGNMISKVSIILYTRLKHFCEKSIMLYFSNQ